MGSNIILRSKAKISQSAPNFFWTFYQISSTFFCILQHIKNLRYHCNIICNIILLYLANFFWLCLSFSTLLQFVTILFLYKVILFLLSSLHKCYLTTKFWSWIFKNLILSFLFRSADNFINNFLYYSCIK